MNDLFAPRVGDAADRAFAAKVFDLLARKTGDGVGITRASYGPGESLALNLIEVEAREAGLPAERDSGANLVVTLAGDEPDLPFIACGSHLDSVP